MYVLLSSECKTTTHMAKFLSLVTSEIVIFANLPKKRARSNCWLVHNI